MPVFFYAIPDIEKIHIFPLKKHPFYHIMQMQYRTVLHGSAAGKKHRRQTIMLGLKKSFAKKAKKMRHCRDMRFFAAGILAGSIAVSAVSKLCGKIKCKKCVKKMLAGKE